jgi:hypothetical protein
MPVLRGMDGKFYDVPDDQAAHFEVPREKVKELLAKSGGPPAAGPGRPGPRPGPPGGQVTIQIFPPAGGHAPSAPQHHDAGGEVDPYWWWWNNYWGNY